MSVGVRMTRRKNPPRVLHSGHFAFMRALAQGVDERASWDRYLSLEGEHSDLRQVRRTITWIRDQFAAAARREHKPGTARLILLDPDRFASAHSLPSLAEFAEARGLMEFSEDEQLEAYQEAYPNSGGGGQGSPASSSRRGRVIERQLDALRWLQGLVAQDPKPGDGVAAWLNPSVAARLERAGVATLVELVQRVNDLGARWWADVPGVGERKASRILDWLHANEEVLGLRVGRHAATPRAKLCAVDLAAVVSAATAIRPYEKFILPAELDGRSGRCRELHAKCLLMATNDHEAVDAWLASKKTGTEVGTLTSTQRAYRKEAERLMLWAILERKKALSSLSAEDVAAYRSFLSAPPADWCGPRYHQRWSPRWRPLEGPLGTVALRQSLIVLKSLFGFWVSQAYVVGNPFAASALPAQPQRPPGTSRTLTFAQWDHIDGLLQVHGDTEVERRLRRGMRWLYATGLRLGEITKARCEDLMHTTCQADDGALAPGWQLRVTGKGGRSRHVPVPAELVRELGVELLQHGFDPEVGATSNRGIHVLACFGSKKKRPTPWSGSGLYQAIKAFLAHASQGLDEVDAYRLKGASAHWLRHSHGVHALQGRGEKTVTPLQLVQNNLGHASIATTSMYLHARGES